MSFPLSLECKGLADWILPVAMTDKLRFQAMGFGSGIRSCVILGKAKDCVGCLRLWFVLIQLNGKARGLFLVHG